MFSVVFTGSTTSCSKRLILDWKKLWEGIICNIYLHISTTLSHLLQINARWRCCNALIHFLQLVCDKNKSIKIKLDKEVEG